MRRRREWVKCISKRTRMMILWFNPFTPIISLLILLTVCHTLFIILVWRIFIFILFIFLYSHLLPSWDCIDIVRRNSFLVTLLTTVKFIVFHVNCTLWLYDRWLVKVFKQLSDQIFFRKLDKSSYLLQSKLFYVNEALVGIYKSHVKSLVYVFSEYRTMDVGTPEIAWGLRRSSGLSEKDDKE